MPEIGRIAATLRPMAQSIPKLSFPDVAPTTQMRTSPSLANFFGSVVHSLMTGYNAPNSPAFTKIVPIPSKLEADPAGACPISKVAISPSVARAQPHGKPLTPPTPHSSPPAAHPTAPQTPSTPAASRPCPPVARSRSRRAPCAGWWRCGLSSGAASPSARG